MLRYNTYMKYTQKGSSVIAILIGVIFMIIIAAGILKRSDGGVDGTEKGGVESIEQAQDMAEIMDDRNHVYDGLLEGE